MEKFFTPVYRPPTQDEIKLRKHKNHPHDHPQHHHHPHPAYHSQDESHSYTKLDGNDENTDDSQAHHHQHRRHQQAYHLHDNLPHDYHQPQHPQHHHYPPQESEIHNQQQTVTLSRAASSLSSSSSSSLFSSSSWQTEASVNDPFSARPAQHSLSCSNILEVRTGFREDDGSEPIVFATVKRGAHKASPYGSTEGRSRQNEHRHAPSYDRDQSHSDEGLLQTSEDEVVAGRQRRVAHLHHGALYKTASLGRSLAFSEENLVLGASGRPQRGVPSNQIPGKGILKNREPPLDIRKARSMEVLSSRVAKGQGKGRDKGKEVTPAEIKIARENFVQGKLQFSAFLDEITKQVISPSNLNILGVNNDKTPGDTPEPVRGPGTAKPQLPIKKHRESCSGEEKEQHHKPPATQEKRESCGNSPSCHSSHTDQSDPDKLTSYVARRHRGSPPPHHHPQTPSDGPHPGGNRKKENISHTFNPAMGTQALGNKRKDMAPTRPWVQHRALNQSLVSVSQTHLEPETQPPPVTAKALTRVSDIALRQHARDTLIHITKALQEENTDLHQNLLQTVVCIESLEAELNRTREELSHVKDKYKRSGNTPSESLSSERKYLINRIAELSSELEEAHRTIAALETINVPCLIKELLEKHFDSAEAVQKFLKTATAVNHPKMPSPPDPSQSGASNVVEVPHDWLTESEAGPRRVTAFMPWKQEASAATASTDGGLPGAHGASQSQPFSITDISAAIYKKIASEFTANHKPSQTKSLQGCPKGTNHTGTTRPPAHVHQVLETAELAPGLGDVTYLSAQQVLDEFMNQLQPQNQASGGKEQQVSHI
ncbi:unnamed protein product [Merluccius merluccius]